MDGYTRVPATEDSGAMAAARASIEAEPWDDVMPRGAGRRRDAETEAIVRDRDVVHARKRPRAAE